MTEVLNNTLSLMANDSKIDLHKVNQEITEEVKLSCIYNEEVNQIPTTQSVSEGIQANDIGSLLEQFLEYEQGSDGDNSSYPDSYFMTPVASPRSGSNEDQVLGRLMIVQEKLNQEVQNVEKNDAVTTEGEAGTSNIDLVTGAEDKADKLKCEDGILRTVNGVHPKGNNIRMADSPKFAKFKKKKPKSIPIVRRTHSGPTTPRSISPNEDQANKDELKRREAKLIEALALTMPKSEFKNSIDKNSVNGAKRDLDKTATKNNFEPLASRLTPVVSKRQRGNNKLPKATTLLDPRFKLQIEMSSDPRLIKKSYCETSNVMQLLNTNLDQISGSTVNHNNNTTVDDVGIVDMTIDHEALSGTIITNTVFDTPQKDTKLKETVPNSESERQEETVTHDVNVTTIGNVDNVEVNRTELEKNETKISDQQEQIVDINKNITGTNFIKTEKPTPTLEESLLEPPKTIIKPPKNYRKMNSMNSNKDHSSSESEYESNTYNKTKKKPVDMRERLKQSRRGTYKKSSRSRSRSLSRDRSRSLSRDRSRSPHDRNRRSISPHDRHRRSISPLSKKELYKAYNISDHVSSDEDDHDGKGEKIDINNKLSELSNPVPYDIEHERKLRFLVGRTDGKYTERRNIYAGGITRSTGKQELLDRFRRFGKIEKITLHFRDRGDNYAFIVFENPDQAMRAIEEGNDDPSYPRLELCFGGRRRFVGGSYVDFDGNNSYLEENERNNRLGSCDSPEDDFDRLLKMATQNIKRKKETILEWD